MREQRIHELVERLEQYHKDLWISRGWLVFQQLGTLRGSFLVFERNYTELASALEKFRDPAFYLPTLDREHPERLDDFLLEITRLLHNYAAAAISLADHTRIVANELYAQSPFLAEYGEQVKGTFAESPVARFVHGLRNYMLHYRLPFPISHLTADHIGTSNEWNIETHLTLLVADLKKWGEWHPRAEEYLAAGDAQLDLHQLVTDYTSSVKSFRSWLQIRQQEVHKKDMDELSRRLKAIRAVEDELEGG